MGVRIRIDRVRVSGDGQRIDMADIQTAIARRLAGSVPGGKYLSARRVERDTDLDWPESIADAVYREVMR